LGLAFTVELVPFARLWFDEHHDGLMLKNALDVYAGLIPYKQSYNQYGFLPSVLEAALMHVLGPTLLTLKLAAVIAYAFAAGTLVLVFRRAMPLVAAVGAVAIWMVAQPEVSSTSLVFLPWPSIFAVAFIAAATLCHLRSFEADRQAAVWAGASGVSAVAVMCCRLSVGTVLVAALVVDYLVRSMRGERAWRLFTAFLAAVLVTTGIVVLTMLALGALRPMIQQTILQPEAYFGQIGPLTFFWDVLPPAVAWLLGVGFCCLGLRWMLGFVAERYGEHTSRLVGLTLTALLPTAAVVLTQTGAIVVPLASWWPSSVVAWEPGWLSWAAIEVAAALLAVVLAAQACLAALGGLLLGMRRVRSFAPPALTTIAFVGAAGIAQFYPVFEARHMYYSCVPAIGLLVWQLLRIAGRRPLAAVVVLLVVSAVPAAASVRGAINKLDVPEAHLPAFAVLSGTIESPLDVPYTPLLVALKSAYAARPNAPMLNLSEDALWGSLGRNMSNPDAYFVTWPCPANPASDSRFIFKDRPFIWWESLYPAQLLQAYAQSIGYRVAATATPITSWRLPTYLLLPGPRIPRPPYTWPFSAPPPPWATGPNIPISQLPNGCGS
jgi:hypothetical protein